MSSFPRKSDLGVYFRNRLGKMMERKLLRKPIDYGRTDAMYKKIGHDLYYIDFQDNDTKIN